MLYEGQMCSLFLYLLPLVTQRMQAQNQKRALSFAPDRRVPLNRTIGLLSHPDLQLNHQSPSADSVLIGRQWSSLVLSCIQQYMLSNKAAGMS